MPIPKFFQNLNRLFTTKGMFIAYCQWLFASTLKNNAPRLQITNQIYIGEWISFSEYWSFRNGVSPSEKEFINKHLGTETKSKKIAIDIGANIGLFTAYLTTFDSTIVHSFEPVPQTFSRLEINIINNNLKNKVILNSLAVGEKKGVVKFAIRDESPATNKISVNENINDIKVNVTTLDDYCQENKIDYIDFLKIDVEGMEDAVVWGGYEMLVNKKIKEILIEICPTNLNNVGSSIKDLYKSIIDVGYYPYKLSSSYIPEYRLTLDDLEKMVLENIVLLPM